MAEFSEFLYTLRKEKGLTQSELAAKLGVTNKAVSKWETGEAMPDTAQLLPLSEIFGVSVDELLRGERSAAKDGEEAAAEERIRFTKGDDTVEITSDGSVFVNGAKAEHPKKTVHERILDCVCVSWIALSVIVYIALGCATDLWHPLWCIPASAAISCGIAGCIFDMCDRTKREQKRKKGENVYTGSVCGILMLASLIVFLCVGSVCGLWEIMWISPVAGVCACMVIGTIGAMFNHKKEK